MRLLLALGLIACCSAAHATGTPDPRTSASATASATGGAMNQSQRVGFSGDDVPAGALAPSLLLGDACANGASAGAGGTSVGIASGMARICALKVAWEAALRMCRGSLDTEFHCANATYLASEMADEAVLPSYRRFLRRWLPGILGWIF